jgi:hypothetical protein
MSTQNLLEQYAPPGWTELPPSNFKVSHTDSGVALMMRGGRLGDRNHVRYNGSTIQGEHLIVWFKLHQGHEREFEPFFPQGEDGKYHPRAQMPRDPNLRMFGATVPITARVKGADLGLVFKADSMRGYTSKRHPEGSQPGSAARRQERPAQGDLSWEQKLKLALRTVNLLMDEEPSGTDVRFRVREDGKAVAAADVTPRWID